jgi:lipopolysaccharide transport system ATP-binding protein
MPSPIISVEHLSKKYRIAHQGPRYATLRDVLEAKSKSMLARLRPGNGGDSNGPSTRSTNEDFWALKDVSFDVQQGEVLGLIGRNGAGKSTLLKILSRITDPTEGRVTIRGRVASLLEVGTGFHMELTGRENVYLNGAILGMSRTEIKRKFDEIIDFAGVEKFLDTPVKRYSSGMYVRLAFAVAAHLEPEILIVDEVLAVGDAEFQKKCLGKMKDVSSKDGRTVLFVSHNMAVMKAFCRSIIWLNQGQMLQSAPPEKVINSYLQAGFDDSKVIVDLRDVRREGNAGIQMRITRVEWLTGLPLFHSEAVKVRVDFEAYADVSEATVGIGFSSPEGTRLLTYETDDPGERVDLTKGCSYSVTLEIDSLPLPPGNYTVDVGSRSGPMQGVDYLPGCMYIDIAPGKTTQGHQASGGAGVRLPSYWNWKNLDAEIGEDLGRGTVSHYE